MKAIWSGSISFGLVSIPIKLYSAVETKTLGFKMLCKKCKTPVHYKRYCEGCKQELAMSDIVKGLEISRGEYLIFTDEELERIKPAKSDQIVIREFVDIDEIAPIYYNKFYYCAPAKARERAFFLFNEVLRTSGKVAIGRFVMRDKEYVCAIESYKSGLLLTTLNYKYEIRDINDIKELKEIPELNKQEIDLAAKLVDQLYEEKFDLSEFKDTFAEQLKDLLKNKDRVEIKDKKEKRVTEKPLIEALKASLNQ